MKQKVGYLSFFIWLALALVARTFGGWEWFAAAVAIGLGLLIWALVRQGRANKKYSICPRCGAKTVKQKRVCFVDPQKERVHMLGTRILGGNVTKYRFVTVCKHCGWECDSE